jgi:hypothetical protein
MSNDELVQMISELADQYIDDNDELVQMISKMISELDELDELTMKLLEKRLETGYADNQTKWPYWVQPRYYNITEWDRMDKWVREIFGNGDWMTEHGLWVGSDRKYWFRNESDRTMFLLKWL